MSILVALVAAVATPFVQSRAGAPHGSVQSRATAVPTISGRILTADGWPAAGAVVTSSAGSKTVTGVDGVFVLAIDLPPGARGLDVTASGTSGSVSVPVAVDDRGPLDPGDLFLVPATDCYPGWTPRFGEFTTLNGPASALVVFDDGTGPALFAGGAFSRAGSASVIDIARWDGSDWTAAGVLGTTVTALVEFDDGTGPALYAGRNYITAGTSPERVLKRNGTAWTGLGGPNDAVNALVVFDDGSGPALYAGGKFTTPGSRIAKWNGTSWSALGTGVNGEVLVLAVFDDGSGPALYAGGAFATAGGVAARNVAKWNGTSWSAVGVGLRAHITGEPALTGFVGAFAVYDDGAGPKLHAGGYFTVSGGEYDTDSIAKWDGTTWQALGIGVDTIVDSLAVFDDGSGPALYVGGGFDRAGGVDRSGIARWDGASWSSVGTLTWGHLVGVGDFAIFDDGSGGGPALFAGVFQGGGPDDSRIAKWDGVAWSYVGRGFNADVRAVALHDDGSAPHPDLYVGGSFTIAGGVDVRYVARWDGSAWSALGSGMDWIVAALCTFDPGTGAGPALYAGGSFTHAGGVASNGIAKWDGTSWSALGSGVQSPAVRALTVFDDGSGQELFVGGGFGFAGGVSANGIAKWNGTSWSPLGSGTTLSSGTPAFVAALAVFDDGSGPALFAGGTFTVAGGVSAKHVAKWNGATWSALGGGTNGDVLALAVFDDGSGPALYAGGSFTNAGLTANRIAKWDGSSWSQVGVFGIGNGFDAPVSCLSVLSSGRRPALHAGGSFTTVEGIAVNHLATWDGHRWAALGSGVNGAVFSLGSFKGPGLEPPLVIVGGAFDQCPASGDAFLAAWRRCLKATVR